MVTSRLLKVVCSCRMSLREVCSKMNFLPRCLHLSTRKSVTGIYTTIQVDSIVVRWYSRGIRRRPGKILAPEEVINESNNKFNAVTASAGFNRTVLGDNVQQERSAELKRSRHPFQRELASQQEHEPGIAAPSSKSTKTITSLPGELWKKVNTDRKGNTKKLSEMMILVKSRKSREKLGKILLEGERLIRDALEAGAQAETIYFSKKESIAGLPMNKLIRETELIEVNYKDLQTWSELSTSPGIIGVFKQPDVNRLNFGRRSETWPITVICDNIRDPGNLGTILRCAAGIGCEQVILSKGCVDGWNPKVLRSSAGAHFRIPLRIDVDWELIANYIKEDSAVFLADNAQHGNAADRRDSVELRKLIAAREAELGQVEQVEVDESGATLQKKNAAYADEKLLSLYCKVDLPRQQYSQIEVKQFRPLVLVIGGETHGLSGAAYKLASDYDGSKVFIPLANGVDSLNSGVALGILGYELRRRLHELKHLVPRPAV